MLKVSIPVEQGNTAFTDGSLPKTIESIVADCKPEAGYFTAESGKRTRFLFFDLKDTSQIPAIAEPWFLAFNAEVQMYPAMNMDDLKNSAPGMEKAVHAYGKLARGKAA
jgi:hypothetical protein